MALTQAEERAVQKTVPDDTCARCRRKFEVGDRLQHAFILYNAHAYNPNRLTEQGMDLGTDCEFVHCSCEDPQLTGKLASQFRKLIL